MNQFSTSAVSGSSAADPAAKLRWPSLSNLSPAVWQGHADLAYIFARHVRHALANLHCALRMFEMVELVQKTAGAAPIPPEFDPQAMKARIQNDVRQVVSMSNDLALLSQTASTSGYRPARTAEAHSLLEDAVIYRLGASDLPPQKLLEQAGDAKLISLGDMLAAAVGVFYFQWTPWVHSHARAAGATAWRVEGGLTLQIPADDTENLASFARRLSSPEACRLTALAEKELSVTTGELALWLARFIVLVHGGTVEVNPNDPELAVRLTLPVAP